MTKKEVLRRIEQAKREGASHFDLGQQGLTTLPPEIGQLTQLRSLYLDRNQLSELPPEIGQLTQLQGLQLHRNQLSALPPAIGQLTGLRTLFLHKNQLTTLSPDICKLTRLEELYLSSNRLVALLPEVGQLAGLSRLSLYSNQLTALPPEIGQLKNLKDLDLDGNPLTSPPPEIIQQGTKAVLAYLRKLPRAKKQWVSKLILVGEGGVGKTTLVKRLLGESRDMKEKTTHGIRVRDVPLGHPDHDGVTMQLKSWDFGGQDILHATHQFFLSRRSLYLLVWHARLGWEAGKLDYWLDNIKARATESPILIVATHLDERKATLPLKELQKKYPQVIGFQAVSCDTDENLDKLQSAIQRASADLPLMGEEWPADWLKAAEAVRKLKGKQKCITPQRLTKVLKGKKVRGKDAQVLTSWLHELGDILHFRDKPDLDDIVILDPQWVTESISKVLESDKVVKGLGIFRREHMDELWHELDFHLRDHFLRLMEQFDLSYRTLDREDISIVVERLDENPAKFQPAWDKIAARRTTKEISMTFELQGHRPPGIPTWFIARSHRFSTKTHWRYGGLFADGKQQHRHLGLLEASPTGGTVRLAVRGPYPHNFFTLLRDGFELTLDRFQGLAVKRKIPCSDPKSIGCTHEFALEHLQNRLDVEPPKHSIECPVCYEDLEVFQLLYGIDPRTQSRVLDKIGEMHRDVRKVDRRVRKVDRGVRKVDTQLKELRALAEREFLNAYKREQANVDIQCPNVFVLEPDPADAAIRTIFTESEPTLTADLLKRILRKKIVVQFFCQQPGEWHRTYDGGRYTITKPARWVVEIAPFAKHLLSVLKHAAPFVGPVAGIASADWEKNFAHHIKFMTELAKGLDGDKLDLKEDLDSMRELGHGERLEGVDLLPLRRLLDHLDPDREKLGLKHVVTQEGHNLWLCDIHAEEYRR